MIDVSGVYKDVFQNTSVVRSSGCKFGSSR